ncbi:MAG TPA: plasmid pRiA4b ORF-3 family protein [Sporichthya sp.]|nr:plasmid pRiA4b ORF-3 family protein [Sporichthya sp.]
MAPSPAIYQLKITLLGVTPQVWRRVLVPADVTLDVVHAVIQTAMGWTDKHLHEFAVGDDLYGPADEEDDETVDESTVRLFTVAGEGDQLRYVYDFGDDWRHDVIVEKVLAPEPGAQYPWCLTGRQACPPEDVGGPSGYADLLAVLADSTHPEHAEAREWAGQLQATFDLNATNEALEPRR